MAKAFHCRPREMFGLTDEDDSWLGLQIDRSVWKFGSFIEGKIHEKYERPVSQTKKRNTEWVDRYTPKQIYEMIHGTLLSDEQREAQAAEAKAVRSGQVDPYSVEAEEDALAYIPPSKRGQYAVPVGPVSE